MIRTSETINELSESFAKAQAKFGAAIKVSLNPAFRSKYADLASVIDATLEHLNAEGIGVMQHPALDYKPAGDGVEAFVTVTTRLQHRSGQWMESDVSLPAVMRDRFDAQSVGSAITYACRYALRSICTVPQADDDANAASGVGTAEAAKSVGEAKIAELKAKQAGIASNSVPSLFYTWFDESQTAEITGHVGLMKANEDLLRPLKLGKQLIANADQLEALKYELDQRKVNFKALKVANA